MSGPHVELTSARLEDADAIADLQEYLWHAGRDRNLRYLKWKYAENPYLDHRYVVLAWAGSRLVGMIGAFGASWAVPGGDPVMLPCLADTVVAPEFRGGPLFRLMIDDLSRRLLADGVPWLLDFSDQPSGPSMRIRGWKPIGPWAIATSGDRDTVSSGSIGAWESETTGARSGVTLHRSVSGNTAELAGFMSGLDLDQRVRHVRDQTYLDWRFANPLGRYFFLMARKNGVRGYLVAHRTTVEHESESTPTTVLDCEADSDAVWADLMEAAVGGLPGRELLMWARDLSTTRAKVLEEFEMSTISPIGRPTIDVRLPSLMLLSTGASPAGGPLDFLERPASWDLSSVCGRSWR